MILVERVVRPLQIPLVRQKRLRAEFLDHLQAVFAEESARDSNRSAALARTAERFGQPQVLVEELRKSINWSERRLAWFEACWTQRHGESNLHFLLRFVAGFLTLLLPVILLVMIGKHFLQTAPLSAPELRLFAGLAVFLTGWLGGMIGMGLPFAQEWESPRRRWNRVAAWGLGLMSLWPFSLCLLISIAGGNWSDYGSPKIAAETMFIGGTLMTMLMSLVFGVAHHRETAYRAQWAELKLD